jgi:hypothetical protein
MLESGYWRVETGRVMELMIIFAKLFIPDGTTDLTAPDFYKRFFVDVGDCVGIGAQIEAAVPGKKRR